MPQAARRGRGSRAAGGGHGLTGTGPATRHSSVAPGPCTGPPAASLRVGGCRSRCNGCAICASSKTPDIAAQPLRRLREPQAPRACRAGPAPGPGRPGSGSYDDSELESQAASSRTFHQFSAGLAITSISTVLQDTEP